MEEYIDIDALIYADDVEAANEGHNNTPPPGGDQNPELMILDDFIDDAEDFGMIVPLPSPSDSVDFEIDLLTVDEEDQTVPDYAPSTSSGIRHDRRHIAEMMDADTTSGSSGYSDTPHDEQPLLGDVMRQRLLLAEYHPITICIMGQENADELVVHIHAMLKLIGFNNIPELMEMATNIKSKLEFHMNGMQASMQRLKTFHKMCTKDTRFHNLNGSMPHELIPLLPTRQNTRRFEIPFSASHAEAKEQLDEQIAVLNGQIKKIVDLLRYLTNEFSAMLRVLDDLHNM